MFFFILLKGRNPVKFIKENLEKNKRIQYSTLRTPAEGEGKPQQQAKTNQPKWP